MFKKIGMAVTGIVLVGIVSVGLNSSFVQQAEHGDVPAPARPDYVNIGETGGAPADNRGDGGAPANFNKGDGGAPVDNRGDGGGVSQL
ncbi:MULTISPECIES: Phr family secreted Rap phosphatase inhibitor [Bacillus cereus group]|uniref:Phr family secreted Rap phosphatase inhibitor n=1 Tax=Bacillus cereus group TaxID=86661 RepID=UPI0009452426|nr:MULTISPECIES: Phr family secreted Rap phosphatase inhibitor [unclassified Bacillus cereus group]MCM0001739.1 Phr family secreted Rap phosphatase inhibitor [Bacillus paranthracis]MDA1953506.1 Phr family secreted Rap phosphatase inhibitor [Bacillus cereus group sp. BcHK114]MDA2154437.1 Phr family secreted Rap phosphatase inhibitor [Bacillus cereus group sp. Bc253]MDA2238488.1 Phr family secreted Rap phosphatase inhibitor [Bacillus cereus group sp. Bc222]MDA2583928.1 Phr family secreted Rap ph